MSSAIDTCGYENEAVLGLDTRNAKWQARQNGISTAAANKSFNHKEHEKYIKRKLQKDDREQ